jgi:hypothetical protein
VSYKFYFIISSALIFLFCSLQLGCANYVYIKATNFKFNQYVKELEVGTARSKKMKISFPQRPLIYELKKNKAKPLTVRSEIFNGQNTLYYIHYYYYELKIADDVFTDDELFPIVRNSKDTIVGFGWNFVDSLNRSRRK